jgi:hypothetical protein
MKFINEKIKKMNKEVLNQHANCGYVWQIKIMCGQPLL